jgi:hypothetical protein
VAAFAGLLRQSAFQVTNIRFFALAVKVLSLLVSKKKKKKKNKYSKQCINHKYATWLHQAPLESHFILLIINLRVTH